ncbi:MAG: 4-(cytidine 5'-diphospho)-2-C-methyl-D-erythritol kinase [Actinobacteria bacterium]|nr:4-(cytidine 5'-diphospho)-2-C-methyl-D-erythritol kinase [Actinomycetota bacterium]
MLIKAYAKINLHLDVTGKREDGYHNIESVMQTISLHDELLFELKDKEIEVKSEPENFVEVENNLIFKAANLLRNRYNVKKGVSVNLKKNIPIGAGLGGGSADAAGALIGLNILWDLNLPLSELLKLGIELGSDVPFCILGGTCFVEGKGEKLTKINPIPSCYIVIVNPGFEISTKEIYQKFDEEENFASLSIGGIMTAFDRSDFNGICENMANSMENIVFRKFPELKEFKKTAKNNGAEGALMSGTGPTMFAITQSEEKAKNIAIKFKNIFPFVNICERYTPITSSTL